LTLIKVLQIIGLVALSFAAAGFVLILALVIALAAANGNALQEMMQEIFTEINNEVPGFFDAFQGIDIYESLIAIVIATFAICLLAIVFAIVVSAFTIKGINTLKENFGGTLTDRNFPLFIVILGYISAIGNCISAVGSLVLMEIPLALQTVTYATSLLLLCILLQKYRKQMELLRANVLADVPVAAPMVASVPRHQAPAHAMGCAPTPPVYTAPQPITTQNPVGSSQDFSRCEPTTQPEPIQTPVAEPIPQPAPIDQPMETPVKAAPRRCNGCGNPLRDGARFCENCGRSAQQ
jgi:hypothetical protein